MWTFKRHENPQRMGTIMREAWAIKKASGVTFGAALRKAWAMARERAGARLPEHPPTLLQFLRSIGGLRPCADLRQAGAPLFVLRRNGMPLDYAARRANETGYPVGDCANELLEAIRDECRGRPILSVYDANLVADLAAWRAHHETMMHDEPPF